MRTLQAGASLTVGMALTGLRVSALWVRYASLGGSHSPDELQDYLDDEAPWSAREHDVAAQALNERCSDLGLGLPVAYANEV
jgi:hypothetical protein